jgi:tetratricopeptide (TPR) repeat protein
MADDLRRFLNDEPIRARRPSVWQRLRKWSRRHKAVVRSGVTALVVSLAVLAASVGWVIRDRSALEAAQQAKAREDLKLALERAEWFQEQGKRAEAVAGLERAQALVSEAAPEPVLISRIAALKERLAAEARDEQFVRRFEQIRLEVESQVDVKKSRFAWEAAFPEIREALRAYGIAIGVMAPGEAATCVQGRPATIRRNLVAALDQCLREAPEGDAHVRQWLLATLEGADKDAWRVRVRKAIADRDWETLEEQARVADFEKQPPGFLLSVAFSLPKDMSSTRLELLRRIQRAYPADLWANHALAYELWRKDQPAESIRYFTAALALRPDNPGIYVNRGIALRDAAEVDAAIADFRQAIALAPQYATAHYNLAFTLHQKKELDEAIREYRTAIELDHQSIWFHINLGDALYDNNQRDEAIVEYRTAINIDPRNSQAHNHLGLGLQGKKKMDEAIREYRTAIDLDPSNARAHCNLAWGLLEMKQLDEAILECRTAIKLKPDLALAHLNLGVALYGKKQMDEAIREFRTAMALDPKDARPHVNLGNALRQKQQLEEAIVEYRTAIQLDHRCAPAHFNLGNALSDKRQFDDAIRAYRSAIELDPEHAPAHLGLGNVLRDKNQLEEAIREFQAALKIDSKYAEAHCNLGRALQRQGRFQEALAALQTGHQLGSARPGWRYPSAAWVRTAEQLIELDGKLAKVLHEGSHAANVSEGVQFAWLCQQPYKQLYVAAAGFYRDAFAAEPKLADDPSSGRRYNAACAAALAGCGEGKDAGRLDQSERGRLREQALAWLQEDLVALRRMLEKTPQTARPVVHQQMLYWQQDSDFAAVRGTEALARLPEAEATAWQKLWADVEQLRKTAASQP